MIRPTHCYLGLSKDEKLEIVVSEVALHPLGSRLLRQGEGWPDAVTQFYRGVRNDATAGLEAARMAQAMLRGEEKGSTATGLTIGDTSVLTKKRTRKKI